MRLFITEQFERTTNIQIFEKKDEMTDSDTEDIKELKKFSKLFQDLMTKRISHQIEEFIHLFVDKVKTLDEPSKVTVKMGEKIWRAIKTPDFTLVVRGSPTRASPNKKKNTWTCFGTIVKSGKRCERDTYDGKACCGIHRRQEEENREELEKWKAKRGSKKRKIVKKEEEDESEDDEIPSPRANIN